MFPSNKKTFDSDANENDNFHLSKPRSSVAGYHSVNNDNDAKV